MPVPLEQFLSAVTRLGELQQQEILRKQRELEANVQKPADAERYKVETLASARKFQLETEAAGSASAAKAR